MQRSKRTTNRKRIIYQHVRAISAHVTNKRWLPEIPLEAVQFGTANTCGLYDRLIQLSANRLLKARRVSVRYCVAGTGIGGSIAIDEMRVGKSRIWTNVDRRAPCLDDLIYEFVFDAFAVEHIHKLERGLHVVPRFCGFVPLCNTRLRLRPLLGASEYFSAPMHKHMTAASLRPSAPRVARQGRQCARIQG